MKQKIHKTIAKQDHENRKNGVKLRAKSWSANGDKKNHRRDRQQLKLKLKEEAQK